jgi:hypothetical protein
MDCYFSGIEELRHAV